MKYLTFNNHTDFLSHVEEVSAGNSIFADITNTQGTPDPQYGLFSATYYATLTYCYCGEYIATCSVLLLHANSIEINHDGEGVRQRLQESFEKFKAKLEEMGWTIKRGRWSWEPTREVPS